MTRQTATRAEFATVWFAPYRTWIPRSLAEALPDGYLRKHYNAAGSINWTAFADSLSLYSQTGGPVVFDWGHIEHAAGSRLTGRQRIVVEGVVDDGRDVLVILPDVEFIAPSKARLAVDKDGVWAYRHYGEPK